MECSEILTHQFSSINCKVKANYVIKVLEQKPLNNSILEPELFIMEMTGSLLETDICWSDVFLVSID